MNDDLGRLRRAMADLAEHGGSTDLYERSLRTSHRLRRRRIITATATAAVLAVVVPVTLVNGLRPSSPPVAEPLTPGGSGTTSPVLPSTSAPSPTASRQPSKPPATRSAPAKEPCPVSAATLEQAAGIADTHRIEPADVTCWKDWASAGLTAISPAQQGDGVILFRYDPTTGRWTKFMEGSAFDCAELGIPKTSGSQPPFCTYRS